MRIGNSGCRTYVLQPLFEHREMYARERKAIDLHQPRLGALEVAQRLRGPVLESVVGEQEPLRSRICSSVRRWKHEAMRKCLESRLSRSCNVWTGGKGVQRWVEARA